MRTWTLVLSAALLSTAAQAETTYWVFLGTGGGKDAKGIYRCSFDPKTGALGKPELAAEATAPGFLAIHPKLTHLFSVGTITDSAGKRVGGVSSYTLDTKTGALKLVNQQSAVGAGPCHINCDREGKHVAAANYGGGSMVVLPFDASGKLGEPTSFVQHKGSSVVKSRQESPHAHSANFDRAGRFLVVADLGLDKLLVYKYDFATGKATANDPPAVDMAPGAGPRHFAFHPTKNFAYANNELNSTVTAMTYNPHKGTFTKLNTLSTLPKPTAGNSTAETVVHPNGKFVYVSNRGHNSIAVFGVNQETGELKALGHQGEGVNIPRNFNIDPTGKWMLVANQNGHTVIVYAIQDDGSLKPTGTSVSVPAPICVRFVPVQ